MTTPIYWGEEKLPDAVYAIQLRKVRYSSLLFSKQPATSEQSDDCLQWETVKERTIKAGTLDRLLDELIGIDGQLGTRHFNIFFATYRAFASTFKVLCRLLVRISDIRSKIDGKIGRIDKTTLDSLRSILMSWLDIYPEDFFEPDDFPSLVQLIEFARHHTIRDLKSKAKRLRSKFIRVALQGGMSTELRLLENHSLATTFESLDYLLCPQGMKSSDLITENAQYVAEQLTYWDVELFRQVLPHQCQGCFWSNRHRTRKEADRVCTVKATIEQFNALTRRVITSIVLALENHSSMRLMVLLKWMQIAEELRILNNFSSLKAVLSGLQSEPVFRLKSTWALVPCHVMQRFRQLSVAFREEFVEPDPIRLVHSQERKSLIGRTPRKSKSSIQLGRCQGMVPYLGTFLTDLTMIDVANPDMTDDGLINFEKRRKEYQILAKLKLFQSAASCYQIDMDQRFCHWFQQLPSLPEKDWFDLYGK